MRSRNVRTEDIARRMGRDRTAVSKILNGKQQMTIAWAEAFADCLDLPIDTILKRAGSIQDSGTVEPRHSDEQGDVSRWVGGGDDLDHIAEIAKSIGRNKSGLDIYTVRTLSMAVGGFKPGDYLLVDRNHKENMRSGEVVIARLNDWRSNSARTVLSRIDPPVLIAESADPADDGTFFVDENNVQIEGKVIASWRL